MPDIEMLQLFSQEFQVSINELLAGERISDADFRAKADENIIAISRASTFSLKDREAYFKQKWRKDHIELPLLLGMILAAAIALPLVFHKEHLLGFVPLLALIEYGYLNNRMMIYVEKNLYDSTSSTQNRIS